MQHPETRKGATPGKRGKGKGGKSPKSGLILPAFVDEAAAKTGRGRTTVAREAQRAAKIPNLDQVVGTSLDQGDELDALAKLQVEAQAPLIRQARTGKRVSAKGAAKNLRRQERERALGEKTRVALQRLGELPRHPVLYVDLPWPWESWSQCIWPSLIALVTDGRSGLPLGVYAVYLSPDGSSLAPVDAAP